ncbi:MULTISPECIES: type IV conjugative transfer system pilin TraA [Serratia]|uniref:type IV conjugative transfer system pilin TraA n=1 Tax=Serratia TaxID=613 RepID=UPI002A599909|nr:MULTISPECIES: type IV conjugative transfer system pilin TraA [Serratia]MDY0768538.1 type IV conjugative transfer system pilin TraA [Serratia nevei]MED6027197.1 type IV conjugative transfer system pilin TraA [Serratia marcescens]
MNASLSAQGLSVAQRQGFSLRKLFSRQRVVNFLKVILPFAVLASFFPEVALAAGAGGKDMLKSGDADVKATAGSGSTMVRWIIVTEVLVGAVMYMATKNLKYLSGFIVVSVLIAVGMKVAGY